MFSTLEEKGKLRREKTHVKMTKEISCSLKHTLCGVSKRNCTSVINVSPRSILFSPSHTSSSLLRNIITHKGAENSCRNRKIPKRRRRVYKTSWEKSLAIENNKETADMKLWAYRVMISVERYLYVLNTIQEKKKKWKRQRWYVNALEKLEGTMNLLDKFCDDVNFPIAFQSCMIITL